MTILMKRTHNILMVQVALISEILEERTAVGSEIMLYTTSLAFHKDDIEILWGTRRR